MAPSSSRYGARVIWIVVHTAEGARNVDDLRSYFNSGVSASSHAGADDEQLEEGWVPYDRAAWTLRDGNRMSDNLELCGFASWSRAEWLRHPGMLRHAATWIRRRCLARGIPMVKLTPSDVDYDRPGVIGHVDYTRGTGDGTHWDPGPGFPWDVVMAQARGEEEYDDMENSRKVEGCVYDLHQALISGEGLDHLRKELGHDPQIRRDLGTVRADIRAITTQLAALVGQVAGAVEAVGQVAAGRELDLAAITAATDAGVRQALAESVVRVDVDVTGPNNTEEN